VRQLAAAYEEGKANAPKPAEKSVPVSKVERKEA
jgi:hypothetical protein